MLKRISKTTTIDEIIDICENNSKCYKEPLVCKQVLIIHGYTVFPRNINYCEYYKELVEISKIMPTKKSKATYIHPTANLIRKCFDHGSASVIEFLKLNGYDAIPVINIQPPENENTIKPRAKSTRNLQPPENENIKPRTSRSKSTGNLT